MKESLYHVTLNSRDKILVLEKDQLKLEAMVRENKIYEYALAKVYKISDVVK